MNCQRSCVDNTLQHDVVNDLGWFLDVSICVFLKSQVVGARANTGICENAVDAAKLFICFLEQVGQICPVAHIGLDKQERFWLRFDRGRDIGADYLGSD